MQRRLGAWMSKQRCRIGVVAPASRMSPEVAERVPTLANHYTTWLSTLRCPQRAVLQATKVQWGADLCSMMIASPRQRSSHLRYSRLLGHSIVQSPDMPANKALTMVHGLFPVSARQ